MAMNELEPKILTELSGFDFIGAFPRASVPEEEDAITVQRLPKSFEVGRQYVWLKKGYADNDEIFRALQSHLKGSGVTIIEAVEIGHRFIGGLAFRISFQDGKYKGSFYNRLDSRIVKNKTLQKTWSFDDYVLVFDETP
jgi:hypothetical protein